MREVKFGTFCTGIGAPEVAWSELGWKPQFFSEIEKFPSAVLKHHYPHVPNLGDMTKLYEKEEFRESDVDVLCAGTPCQSFSIAGLRGGMDDERGNLALEFVKLVAHKRPPIFVWENVPGVLSSKGGDDFASLLGALCGRIITVPKDGWKNSGIIEGIPNAYGLAWTVLDAQFAGLAQRRKRVFVVGCLGNWRGAAAVLFDTTSLRRHPAPSRKKGKDVTEVAGTIPSRGGGLDRPAGNANELDFCVVAPVTTSHTETAFALNAHPSRRFEASSETFVIEERKDVYCAEVSPTLRAGGNKTGGDRPPGTDVDTADSLIVETTNDDDTFSIQAGATRTNPDSGPDGIGIQPNIAYTLEARTEVQAVAYNIAANDANGTRKDRPNGGLYVRQTDVANALTLSPSDTHVVQPKPSPIAYRTAGDGAVYEEGDKVAALTTNTDRSSQIIAFQQDGDGMINTGPIAYTLSTNSHPSSRNTPMIAEVTTYDPNQITAPTNRSNPEPDLCHTLPASENAPIGVFMAGQGAKAGSIGYSDEISPTLKSGSTGTNRTPSIHIGMAVRRLTPLEGERLQGFPDGYTKLPHWNGWRAMGSDETPESCLEDGFEVKQNPKTLKWRVKDVDGPRYKALGNSMAVPVLLWIGRRIDYVLRTLFYAETSTHTRAIPNRKNHRISGKRI